MAPTKRDFKYGDLVEVIPNGKMGSFNVHSRFHYYNLQYVPAFVVIGYDEDRQSFVIKVPNDVHPSKATMDNFIRHSRGETAMDFDWYNEYYVKPRYLRHITMERAIEKARVVSAQLSAERPRS